MEEYDESYQGKTRNNASMSKLPILMYHHVSESFQGISAGNMLISPGTFEKQMFFLHQKGYRCLSLLEVVHNWLERKPQPKHSFVLTFDDGWADNYENALPILKKFGFSSTVFVVVKQVEDGNKHYLSWQEMRELAENDFTFGSHTLTHPMLSKLDSVTIRHELQESKRIIEDRLGLPVHLLAYPWGDANEHIQDVACVAGYLAACGVGVGPSGLFNLWRVPVNEHDNELTFHWKALGGYYAYTWLREMTYLGRKMREFRRRILEKKSVRQ
jgi:peptidoglycan/xylan/chitin deacetylase (PgdA/CDA1 family)